MTDKIETHLGPPSPFQIALESFLLGCQKIKHERMDGSGSKLAKPQFSVVWGRRYLKVFAGRDIFCFIDTLTVEREGAKAGDVLKCASWAKPAKHARGNIFDAKNGLGLIGPYGPAYLR